MLVNVHQLEVLKKARDKAENDDKELFNALSIAIIRLENHKCPVIENIEKTKKYESDYWDLLEGKENQFSR